MKIINNFSFIFLCAFVLHIISARIFGYLPSLFSSRPRKDTHVASVVKSPSKEENLIDVITKNSITRTIGMAGTIIVAGSLYYNKVSTPKVGVSTPFPEIMKQLNPNAGDDANETMIVIFDCQSKQISSFDSKARLDIFTLLRNSSSLQNTKDSIVFISNSANNNDALFKQLPNKWKLISETGKNKIFNNALRKKFHVKESELKIVILDSHGQVVSENGVDLLRISPEKFPWNSQCTLSSIVQNSTVLTSSHVLNESLADSTMSSISLALFPSYKQYFSQRYKKLAFRVDPYPSGTNTSDESSKENHSVGIYFFLSSHKPSLDSIKNLSAALDDNTHSMQGDVRSGVDQVDNINDILLVPLDHNATEFNAFIQSSEGEKILQRFPIIPFNDKNRFLLQLSLQIRQVPSLVMLDGVNGRITTRNGIMHFANDKQLEGYPWKDAPLIDLLDGVSIARLQLHPVLLVFVDSCAPSLHRKLEKSFANILRNSHNEKENQVFPHSLRQDMEFAIVHGPPDIVTVLKNLCDMSQSSTATTGTTGTRNIVQICILDLSQSECSTAITVKMKELQAKASKQSESDLPLDDVEEDEFCNEIISAVNRLSSSYKQFDIEMKPMKALSVKD